MWLGGRRLRAQTFEIDLAKKDASFMSSKQQKVVDLFGTSAKAKLHICFLSTKVREKWSKAAKATKRRRGEAVAREEGEQATSLADLVCGKRNILV